MEREDAEFRAANERIGTMAEGLRTHEAAGRVEQTAAPVEIPEAPVEPVRVNTTPVKDIRLEVQGGDNKVELRLTERAGEVHVSVRTPTPK